ncbi:MAG: hypothetical protein JWP04_684 [Belnapia sp.]|nr:hypothetical protein [Belnapia sp.]
MPGFLRQAEATLEGADRQADPAFGRTSTSIRDATRLDRRLGRSAGRHATIFPHPHVMPRVGAQVKYRLSLAGRDRGSGGEGILAVERRGGRMHHAGDADGGLHRFLGNAMRPHDFLVRFHAHAAAVDG